MWEADLVVPKNKEWNKIEIPFTEFVTKRMDQKTPNRKMNLKNISSFVITYGKWDFLIGSKILKNNLYSEGFFELHIG